MDRYTSLFLDRDGVINCHRPADYVKTIEEFEFLPGSLEALRLLSPLFKYIFIVTNQRGVGKGVMTARSLEQIHAYMLNEIIRCQGRIDHIYVCTDIETESFNRKPQPGMAAQALQDYPDISFSQSMMVGDSVSDLLFARNVGMRAVFIDAGIKKKEIKPSLYDARFPDLYTFAEKYIKDPDV